MKKEKGKRKRSFKTLPKSKTFDSIPNPSTINPRPPNLRFMAGTAAEVPSAPPPPPPPIEQRYCSSALLLRLMSKRRTWVCLFVSVYSLLLFLSWNLLKSVLSRYELESAASSSSGWPALYASLLLGLAFGVLSMVAALAVAVPATLVTWITVLVLLTFCGKPRKTLVVEGKQLTAEITGFVIKVLIKEGNLVAAFCAVLGYFALVRHKENGGPLDFQ